MKATAVAGTLILLSACSMAGTDGPGDGTAADEGLRVGLISQVRIPATEAEYDAFKETFIEESGLDEDQIEWVENYAEGDAEKCPVIARALEKENLDVIAAIGTPCIIAMAAVEDTVPIIALGIGDPVAAGVAKSLDSPGGNVTGSYRGVNAAGPLEAFLTITPKFTKLGFIYDQSNESIAAWAENLTAAAEDQGITLISKGVTSVDQVGTTVRTLIPEVDAILLGPDGMMSGAIAVVAAEAKRAEIPVYTSGLDTSPETLGIVADVGASNPELGQIGAEAAIEAVINGKKAGTIPFRQGTEVIWRVNPDSASQAGVKIPDESLSDAVIF